jgi:hypothetical protein
VARQESLSGPLCSASLFFKSDYVGIIDKKPGANRAEKGTNLGRGRFASYETFPAIVTHNPAIESICDSMADRTRRAHA